MSLHVQSSHQITAFLASVEKQECKLRVLSQNQQSFQNREFEGWNNQWDEVL